MVPSPGGTTESPRPSAVPPGLHELPAAVFPGMDAWATFSRPSGRKAHGLAGQTTGKSREAVQSLRLMRCRHELYADGPRHFHDLPRRMQSPGFEIDPKYHNAVGVLVGGQQVVARRVDAKIAGCLALGGLVASAGQLARGR